MNIGIDIMTNNSIPFVCNKCNHKQYFSFDEKQVSQTKQMFMMANNLILCENCINAKEKKNVQF
jgi:phage terminase large subunit GpA-like protein